MFFLFFEIHIFCPQILGTDYEIGHFLRARIIPKAILYYTGDVIDDGDDFEEEEEEEEEEDEEEEEESNDDNSSTQKRAAITSGRKNSNNPNECPNQ